MPAEDNGPNRRDFGSERQAFEAVVRAGQVIKGNYRIERELGRGGMGVVVHARDLPLDRDVAIKFLAPGVIQSGDAIQRFLREGRAAARIQSDHVARVFTIDQLPEGIPYIVMEFLEGMDLGVLLSRQGPLPIGGAVNYVRQSCHAVAEAHRLGIVHRDLKPSNLFRVVRSDGDHLIKVLDFGISKSADSPAEMSQTATGAVMGSPYYMSPEQLRGDPSVDGKSDIWSLGVVLFELLTGRPPFAGSSIPDLILAIVSDGSEALRALLPNAPAALEEVIRRCLKRDRAKRFATVDELADALAPFDTGPNVVSPRSEQTRGEVVPAPDVRSRTSPGLGDLLGDDRHGTSTLQSLFVGQRPVPALEPLREVIPPPRRVNERPSAITPLPRRSEAAPRELPSSALRRTFQTSAIAAAPSSDWTPRPGAAPWDALEEAIPGALREHDAALRDALAAWFDRSQLVCDNVIQLHGNTVLKEAKISCFAVFLGTSARDERRDGSALGTRTFMAHAEPLGRQLSSLKVHERKLVIVVSGTPEFGKGVWQRISSYQEQYSATVVPLYVGDVAKAQREGRIGRFLEQRLLDLHPRPNLYARRTGDPDPTRIVGLGSEIHEIVASLQRPGAVLLVSGAPGCGKSSLVTMTEYGLENVRFIKIHCAQLPVRDAATLAGEVMNALNVPEQGTGGPLGAFLEASSTVLRSAAARTARSTSVLVLEDADWLAELLTGPDAAAVRDLVTALAQRARAGSLSLLLTGCSIGALARRKLGEWHNPLAPLATRYPLPPLSMRSAERVIRELGHGCNLKFEDGTIKELRDASGGNVDILLRICSHIVEAQRKRHDEHPLAIVEIRLRDVRLSVDELATDCVALEGGVLDLLDDLERRIIEVIALHEPRTLRRLQLLLEDVPPAKVASRLDHLRRTGLVGRGGTRLALQIPLLARWLKANVSAQMGEAKRARRRRVSISTSAITLGLFLGAVYFVIPSAKYVSTSSVELGTCRFTISHPAAAGPGEEIYLQFSAESCNAAAVDAAFGVQGQAGTLLEEKDGMVGPILSPIRCFGGACAGSTTLTVGKHQSGPIHLSVVSADSHSAHVLIDYDELSRMRGLATAALQVVSAALTLLGVFLALRKRTERLLRGAVALTERKLAE